VVPILPGTLFPPAGAAAVGALEGWDTFAWWFWVAQALLVIAYFVVDHVAQVLGVKRAGGSRAAMFGGAAGALVGPFALAPVMGPFALLFGPPVGAVAGTLLGESWARKRAGVDRVSRAEHQRLGTGALLAYVAGTVVKLAVLGVQVGLLVLVVL
jgi:uncharacterized protein